MVRWVREEVVSKQEVHVSELITEARSRGFHSLPQALRMLERHKVLYVQNGVAHFGQAPPKLEDPDVPFFKAYFSRRENTTLVSVLMTCSSAWMESALLDPHGGQRWVIYDEAWRLMSHPALLRRMDAQWRLARHYGIANLLVFHKLSDLDNVGDQGSAMRAIASSLLANAETRIIYRQESDQLGATATALGLTGTEQSLLPGLATGQGLWRIKDRSFVVQHQLHPAELAAFDTTSHMTEGVK